ncbi:MAG: N-acetylmuramic acid 6-phosphate etherase [Planctomycetota bacterium]
MTPPDRSRVATEAVHAGSAELAPGDVAGLLSLMSREDRAVPEAVARSLDRITALVEAIAPRFTRGGRIFYAGAGTSGRLGVLDASECPPTFLTEPGRVVGVIAGGDRALRESSEHLEDVAAEAASDLAGFDIGADDTVIGITAGGTTPYALAAVAYGRERAALAALLTCGEPPSGFVVEHLVQIDTGPEIVAGSTRLKAGTATKLALNMISTGVMATAGKVHRGLMVDVSATNQKLRDRAARIVASLTGRDRGASVELLDDAGGRVKTAVVMHRLGVPRERAERTLDEAGWDLDAALGGRQ